MCQLFVVDICINSICEAIIINDEKSVFVLVFVDTFDDDLDLFVLFELDIVLLFLLRFIMKFNAYRPPPTRPGSL